MTDFVPQKPGRLVALHHHPLPNEQKKSSDVALNIKSAHLIGIGGCGMNAIAWALMACGVEVRGSDLNSTKVTKKLHAAGATIYKGHHEDNLTEVDAVIISTAIPETNPELAKARALKMNILHRAEALALFLETRKSILISGTHGKTTTSALTGILLEAGGLDPWAFVGGHVPAFKGNTRIGKKDFAVAEADESDGSFEKLPVDHLIVTNMEDEHLDYWGSGEKMRAGYQRVMEKVPTEGVCLCCVDDPELYELTESLNREPIYYSVKTTQVPYAATNIELLAYSSEFDFVMNGQVFARFTIGVPGLHNVSNAVASLAMTAECGGDLTAAGKALTKFRGVGRRFEIKGTVNGITVIDDYGHHPTEIVATLKAAKRAAKSVGGKLIVAFQPHRYSRTKDTMDELVKSFGDGDKIFLTNIYSAGEKTLDGVHVDSLYQRMPKGKKRVTSVVHDKNDLVTPLLEAAQSGDLILTLGAGDIYQVADELLRALRNKTSR